MSRQHEELGESVDKAGERGKVVMVVNTQSWCSED